MRKFLAIFAMIKESERNESKVNHFQYVRMRQWLADYSLFIA